MNTQTSFRELITDLKLLIDTISAIAYINKGKLLILLLIINLLSLPVSAKMKPIKRQFLVNKVHNLELLTNQIEDNEITISIKQELEQIKYLLITNEIPQAQIQDNSEDKRPVQLW